MIKVKANNTHDAISCTLPLSNSLIRKLFLWFQHNSKKESYMIQIALCVLALRFLTLKKTNLSSKFSVVGSFADGKDNRKCSEVEYVM